jgi:hypothetical protein
MDNKGGNANVHMWACESTNKNQYFEWDPVTKMLHANKGNCLNAPGGSQLDTAVDLQPCDETASSMQWNMQAEKSKTDPGPTLRFFICQVEEVAENPDDKGNWRPIRVSSIDSSYSCNDNNNAAKWTKMENPLIQFANPDPDSVELFSESELAFEPVWTPNPGYSGMSMITTKVPSKCKGLQVAGNTFFWTREEWRRHGLLSVR